MQVSEPRGSFPTLCENCQAKIGRKKKENTTPENFTVMATSKTSDRYFITAFPSPSSIPRYDVIQWQQKRKNQRVQSQISSRNGRKRIVLSLLPCTELAFFTCVNLGMLRQQAVTPHRQTLIFTYTSIPKTTLFRLYLFCSHRVTPCRYLEKENLQVHK